MVIHRMLTIGTCVFILISIFISGCLNSEKEGEEKEDGGPVKISPEDDYWCFFMTDRGDKLDLKITSDIPVDVYIMEQYDYDPPNPDFSKAKYSRMGITSLSFTYTIPDAQTYCLIIWNPNDLTATVDWEHTQTSGYNGK